MKEEISKLLKLTFLIHFFVSIIFGLLFMVLVELYVGVVGWPYLDPITGRVLGATLLGLAAGSLLAWRETKWVGVKIVVQIEIVWLMLGTGVHIFSIFVFPSLPFMIWVQAAILIFFLGAFLWFYYDQEWAK
ncbi:MAG: hypothetical protein KGD70_07310 [Candidatus Lokiarchaeota archaeon]|nr:hypothetical protein [Candidatus Lokiarchaeota archaeon]